MEPLTVAAMLAAGGSLAALAVWAAWRATRAPATNADEPVELEIVIDEDSPITFVPPAPRAGPAEARATGVPTAVARPAVPPAAGAPRATGVPTPVASRPTPVPLARPPPPTPRSHPERAPAMVLTQGVSMQESAFERRAMGAPARPSPSQLPARPPPPQIPARAPSPRPPMREPPRMKSWAQDVMENVTPEVPTEWARRQVGPVEPGRVAGACGGCGARLSVSAQKPLRIACPVCGRTKLLA